MAEKNWSEAPLGGELLLERYFSGHCRAWGVVEDLRGQTRREFAISANGSWDGQILTLDEEFDYVDGERDTRRWTIRKLPDRTYEGTADGVIGTARGTADGNRFAWRYSFSLPLFGAARTVLFKDRFYLRPNGLLLNIADISKLGITIATVSTVFHKEAAVAADLVGTLEAAE